MRLALRTATSASLAVSPDRAIVYVTGITRSTTGAPARDYTTIVAGPGTCSEYLTVAYKA